ncbi:3-methyl-2-oxobutanoate hydroxymethyltransferase [Citricoccus sp. SGAir0253]|uniref:3-methyl-2-oxobutanoate hydroxymethyltransferase n=1 Tax=Citricoccus sp. SGAir0253 TaxID=2567881 RepID=UPI0010CD34CC|nr:3-methyl-2-oxobutanoate hydroxymethyltransferase [Citricoccus sp. SGAir0253]QCU77852.1 3-methyl-2-oxobutanoate hydroxymethyltransferase [Citricoccus sp. SGAir0253]
MAENETAPYAAPTPSRYRTVHLQQAKDEGRRFAMLTTYDFQMAQVFDEAGVEVLLVGDSAANTMMGLPTTLPITLEQLAVYAGSVVRGARRAMVLCDMPFGSYELSPQQAAENAIRLVKETGVHGVKIEGGVRYAEHIALMTDAGVPVMAHTGFTPQSENVLGGYRVQGRGEGAAEAMIREATTLQDAGAFALLMEMVPGDVARRVDEALRIPTVGIGAGPGTTGQVLVWQDMLGLRSGRMPRFVKQYADLRSVVTGAVQDYRREVLEGTFPAPEHGFGA